MYTEVTNQARSTLIFPFLPLNSFTVLFLYQLFPLNSSDKYNVIFYFVDTLALSFGLVVQH